MKKLSKKWQDLTYDAQMDYLRKHRKSKQRPTSQPTDPRSVELNEIKQAMGGLNKVVEGKEFRANQQAEEWINTLKELDFTETGFKDGKTILQKGNILASVSVGKGKMRYFANFEVNPIRIASCEYVFNNGVYYMKCDGEKIPVDIDAPPKFKANSENIIKHAIKHLNKE